MDATSPFPFGRTTMRYKGTMVRDGEPLGPVYRYAGDGFPGAPEAVETAAAD